MNYSMLYDAIDVMNWQIKQLSRERWELVKKIGWSDADEFRADEIDSEMALLTKLIADARVMLQ